MKKYKHLRLKQRYQIQSLLDMGLSQTKIADYLGVNRSTISRELKRNLPKRGRTAGCYIGEHAQRKTDHFHVSKLKSFVLTEDMKKHQRAHDS